MNEKSLQVLAAWDLERHKDYYPAQAMNKDDCFYNGQIGNCGEECSCLLLGNCPIEEEMLDNLGVSSIEDIKWEIIGNMHDRKEE